jgi:hypothetical protein
VNEAQHAREPATFKGIGQIKVCYERIQPAYFRQSRRHLVKISITVEGDDVFANSPFAHIILANTAWLVENTLNECGPSHP